MRSGCRSGCQPVGIGLVPQEAGAEQMANIEDQANNIQLEGQLPWRVVCDICATDQGEGQQQVLRAKTYNTQNGLKVHKVRMHHATVDAEIVQKLTRLAL